MEYLQHGDLGKHIDKEICEREAQDITCQLVQGLNYLHENKFVHRDLKPQVRSVQLIMSSVVMYG